MSQKTSITAGPVRVEAELGDTDTARAIIGALPINASANTWGNEIYFGIPVNAELEDPQEVVDLGDLGLPAAGTCLLNFFGRRPASQGDEIRPANAVMVIVNMRGDATVFKQVSPGTPISIGAIR